MVMNYSQGAADVFVPDGLPPCIALAQVTHLCVAAHQDDIEIMAHAGIVDCLESPGKWFGGVVVTDGAGSLQHSDPAGASEPGGEICSSRRRRAP